MAATTPEAIDRMRARSRERQRGLWADNPEGMREAQRKRLAADRRARPEVFTARRKRETSALRREVIDGYGGACACCRNGYLPHLTIDHVDGGGADERRRMCGRSIYRRLRALLREGLRDPAYQVLCWNCNAAKHHLGHCSCQDGGDAPSQPR